MRYMVDLSSIYIKFFVLAIICLISIPIVGIVLYKYQKKIDSQELDITKEKLNNIRNHIQELKEELEGELECPSE